MHTRDPPLKDHDLTAPVDDFHVGVDLGHDEHLRRKIFCFRQLFRIVQAGWQLLSHPLRRLCRQRQRTRHQASAQEATDSACQQRHTPP